MLTSRIRWVWLLAGWLPFALATAQTDDGVEPAWDILLPADPRLVLEGVSGRRPHGEGGVAFHREVFPGVGQGGPAVRASLITSATRLAARLQVVRPEAEDAEDDPKLPTAVEGPSAFRGAWLVDGRVVDSFEIDPLAEPIQRIEVNLPPLREGVTRRRVSVVLPLGLDVAFHGIEVPPGEFLESPMAAYRWRIVAYGGAVTAGEGVRSGGHSLAVQLAARLRATSVQAGFAHRLPHPNDGDAIAWLVPDAVVLEFDSLPARQDQPVDAFGETVTSILDGIREFAEEVPVVVVTPLPSRDPDVPEAKVEPYRAQLREVAEARKDPHLHLVEGADLIPNEDAWFEGPALNAGAQARLAGGLADRLRKLLP